MLPYTEASRPSRRNGVEAGLYWYPNEHYTANLEASYTRSRFTDSDPAGNEVPCSIPLVVRTGVTAHYDAGWLASAQLQHFGHYPLIEDNSVESRGSTLLNLRVGREWSKLGVYLDVLNALDSGDHDIDYLYPSRLQGEPAEGVDDIHYHVFPSRSLRLACATRSSKHAPGRRPPCPADRTYPQAGLGRLSFSFAEAFRLQ